MPSSKSKRTSKDGTAVSKSTKKKRAAIPIQQVDETASIINQEEEISSSEYVENDSEDEISTRILEAEERVRVLRETNDALNRRLSAKLKLLELEEQQKSLELSIEDANKRLSINNSREIPNSDISMVQIQTDGLGINRSVGDAPPAKSGTTFVNDDGVVFVVMDKKTAAARIEKCFSLGRAMDSERKKLLLGDENIDFDAQKIKDKLIGFAVRCTTDLMSTGDDMGRFNVATTWLSTSKLSDDAILQLPVMKNIEKFERLLRFQFPFRDYTKLSLDDFVKGGYLKEDEIAILRATLLRMQELMAGIFGKSFSKVFENFIDLLQDKYLNLDVGFLRFLVEEVLYRYGQIMSEPWSESLKTSYSLIDIHSPGNAAILLTTLVKQIVPTRTNQSEYLRKESLQIIRTTKVAKLDSNATITPISNNNVKAVTTAKNKNKRAKKAAKKLTPLPSTTPKPLEIFCLKKLKNILNVDPQDCTYGAACRFSHRVPNTANKGEIQGIIGNKNHPGSVQDKTKIHDALALL
jgi:hypothetical protein